MIHSNTDLTNTLYLLFLDKFTDTISFSISLLSSSLLLAVFRFLRDDLIVVGAPAPAAGAIAPAAGCIAPASKDWSAIFVVPPSCCVSVAVVNLSVDGDL